MVSSLLRMQNGREFKIKYAHSETSRNLATGKGEPPPNHVSQLGKCCSNWENPTRNDPFLPIITIKIFKKPQNIFRSLRLRNLGPFISGIPLFSSFNEIQRPGPKKEKI